MGFARSNDFPIVKNPCPYDNATERTYVRNLLGDMEKHAPGTKDRMMTAIKKKIYI